MRKNKLPIWVLSVVCILFGCNRGDLSSFGSSRNGSPIVLASVAFIDLTSLTGGGAQESRERYKRDLPKILPLQKTALDSAIFYASASYDDSARMLLSRVNSLELSDSLKSVFFVTYGWSWFLIDYDKSTTFADSALAINPRDVKAISLKAGVLSNLDKRDQALALYEYALTIEPKLSMLHRNRASMLTYLGRLDEAAEIIDSMLAVNPTDVYLFKHKGWLLYNRGKFEEAITYYNKALKERPRDLGLYEIKGGALQKLDRFDEAAACFDSIIHLNREYLLAYIYEANALRKGGHYEEALAILDTLENLDPNYGWTNYSRALAYAAEGNRSEMLGAMMRAIIDDSTHRDRIRSDSDFVAFRGDPEFIRLVGEK